jgi:hypothetical protein
MIYKLPIGGEWFVYSDRDLLNWNQNPDKSQFAEELAATYRKYERNRLSFFLAHSGQKDFINDWDTQFAILLAGVRRGKTEAGVAKSGLRMVPCDQSWACFQHHGIDYVPWDGPVKWAFASYVMTTHCQRNLWPKLREILPVDELRDFSPHWHPKDSRKRVRHPNWQGDKRVVLACGSVFDFYAYHQDADTYTGTEYDGWHFDEQVPENLARNAWDRTLNKLRFQMLMTATPHKVEGRPDTGAGSWVHRLVTGIEDFGISYKVYHIKTEDVPEAIMPQKRKDEERRKCIDIPRDRKNPAAIRHGESKWYGTWESGSGLVYDNWNKNIHWIDPFPVPVSWTRFRAMDHGKNQPFACLWGAMAPWGDLVLYREYYEAGVSMAQNAENVRELSGSKREYIDEYVDELEGIVQKMYMEVFGEEQYSFSVMDPRSFKQPADSATMTLGDKYRIMGLQCQGIPGTGMKNEDAIPQVHDWFEPIEGRPHILVRMGIRKEISIQGQPLTGAPRIYVFNTLKKFRAEIEGYIYKGTNKDGTEKPMGDHDHLMTALKYLILSRPAYLGPEKVKKYFPTTKVNPRTKYAGANAPYRK